MGSDESSGGISLEAQFALWDYIVCVVMLSVSVLIGVYYACSGGKQRTQSEWLAGDSNLDWLPTSLSLMASFISAVTLLGAPSILYTEGVMYLYLSLCYISVMPITAFIFMPVFRRTGSISAFKYLEKRFNRTLSLIPCAIYVVNMVIYMGIVLYSPALALNAVTGLSLEGSIIVVAVVCIFYTVIGGMKAIVLTDALQTVIMVGGMITIAIGGTIKMGGFSAVMDINSAGKHLDIWRWSLDPRVRHSGLDCLVGGIFIWLSIYGANQAQVQRYISIRRKQDAHKAILLNTPGLMFLMIISGYCGLLAYAKYALCDPIKAGVISKADQILPYYVTDTFRDWPGFAGLFVSSIFSGTLSTISSGVNALAAIVLTNMVPPNYFKETAGAKVGKLMAVGFGILSISFAFACKYLEAIQQLTLSLFAILAAPVLGLFFLGMCFRRSNSTGALVGYTASLILELFICFGSRMDGYSQTRLITFTTNCTSVHSPVSAEYRYSQILSAQEEYGTFHPPTDTSEWGLLNRTVFRLSYQWYGILGFLVTVIVGYTVSIVSAQFINHPDPNPDLLFYWEDLSFTHEFSPKEKITTTNNNVAQNQAGSDTPEDKILMRRIEINEEFNC